VQNPVTFVQSLKNHRLLREREILEQLSQGEQTISQIARAIYRDTTPELHQAAAMSVLDHLEDLEERGAVVFKHEPSGDLRFLLK